MKIFFKAEDLYDSYLCFEPKDDKKIVLPENISLANFLFFLQGSLEQIRPVLILKNAEAHKQINLKELKSTHHAIADDFIFLNFSIRNSLKPDSFDMPLKSFEDIYLSLGKILKK